MKRYQIALYMRVSKEDASKEKESNSIANQRQLLQKFVRESFSDYELQEFSDDGYSGTNFSRPSVKRMLNQVKNGEIQCIVVKDFSRFSRDYIELGAYLEQIFPFMNVRFISINDDYDSQTYQGITKGLELEFQNLLYDFYSKDISQKVRASIDMKKKKGKYLSGICPFGYKKSPENRHMLLIEEEEAQIVRYIFSLAKKGASSVKIARQLNEEGVKTPLEFQKEKGRNCKNPKGNYYLWNQSYICKILKNEIYIGNIVQKKYTRDEVGGKSSFNAKENWCVTYQHHEPIIEEKLFFKVQKERKALAKRKKNKRHILVGKVVCGRCKRNLTYKNTKHPYFVCPNHYLGILEDCVAQIFVENLEAFLQKEMYEKLQDEKVWKRVYTEQKSSLNVERDGIIERIKILQRKGEKETKETINAYREYALNNAEYFQTSWEDIQKIEKECMELKEKEKRLLEVSKQLEKKEIILKKENIIFYFKILDILVEKIEVFGEKGMQIFWKEIKT